MVRKMCGIAGVMMAEHGVLVEMLRALQLRGSDSTGVAVYDVPLTSVVRINLVMKNLLTL